MGKKESGQSAYYLYGLDLIGQEQTAWQYYHHDGLGSVRHLTDAAGQEVAGYDYYAFGAVRAASGSGDEWRFTGEQWDGAAGLYFLRARYYEPGTGRFVSADPFWGDTAMPQTQHRYLYVANNPVNWIDPSGLKCRPLSRSEGIQAHNMIQKDYRANWNGPGRLVETEYKILGACKTGLRFTWPEKVGEGDPIMKGKPTGSYGKADIAVIVTIPKGAPNELYEIKSKWSWPQGAGEAWWYLQNLLDLDDSDWVLGENYNESKPIGPWPGDPNEQLWAGKSTTTA